MTHQLLTAAAVRPIVWERQGGHCARCHQPMPADRWEAHHRKRRDTLGWCPCNIVGLHARCHTQGPMAVHDHPGEAVELGLIVRTYGPDPHLVPVDVPWPWRGPGFLTCDGMVVSPDALDNPLHLP